MDTQPSRNDVGRALSRSRSRPRDCVLVNLGAPGTAGSSIERSDIGRSQPGSRSRLLAGISAEYLAASGAGLRSAPLRSGHRQRLGRDDAKAVLFLRSVIGNAGDDLRLAQLAGDLSLRSERFRTLWARQDVRRKTSG